MKIKGLIAGLMSVGILLGSTAMPAVALPPARHVFVINLENFSFRNSFGGIGAEDGFLNGTLRGEGVLLSNYYATGHNSLDNYIAEISGQSPTPETQSDCSVYRDFVQQAPMDPHGQAAGAGCVYPATVPTLADQLESKGLTWKGYMEDMGDVPVADGGTRCSHPPVDGIDQSNKIVPDKYATKHNPFLYFHSIIDNSERCRANVAPLTELFSDLQQVSTTPNFSFITPNNCNDGHDPSCTGQFTFDGGSDGALPAANRYLAWLVPQILASPGFRQDGMLIVTVDEADTAIGVSTHPEDVTSCCNEIPGPNSPQPGIEGPGGGVVGAVIVSPFAQPGSTTTTAYNHYSLLRSLEDMFGISTGGTDGAGHLGFAATTTDYPGPGSFGIDVYNAARTALPPVAPLDATPGRQATGPRRAEAGVGWRSLLPTGNDLNGIDCFTDEDCVAVGATGTAIVRSTSGWAVADPQTGQDLHDVACPTATACVMVGDGGVARTSSDGGRHWSPADTASDATLLAVDCVGASRCFAVGPGGAIERSDDGGSSWTSQTSGTHERLTSISCWSATGCMAVGGEVVRTELATSDGGATWNALVVQDSSIVNGTAVDCFSQTTCTEAEAGGGTHWTTDSRASWHGVTKATWPDGSQSGNRLLGVACPTSTICVFATGRSGIARLTMTSSTAGTLLQILPSKRGDDLRDIMCRSATRCIAVGDRGQILSTSDGNNWVSERHGSTAQIRALSCDADGCVAVGDEGSVQTATATGDSWTPRDSGAPSFPSTPTLFGVSCEALDCLAIGSGGTALRSTDAGHTWAPRTTGATEDLHGIACASALTCIAVAGYGRILRTTDFGDTWSSSSPTADTLNGVGCSPTGLTCAAVGSFGTLLVSPDRGATWQRRDSNTLGYLGAATCATDDVCLVVGQNGIVLRSTDGGQTWTRRPTGVDDDLGAVSCFDAERCAAAGSAGTILRTFDAGATWSPVGTGTRRLLSSVACISATSCLAGGEGGAEIEAAAQSPPVPDLAVSDAVAREGYGLNPRLRFAIALSAPTTVPVVAHYASSDGTATTADGDYSVTAGDLVIQPGQMSTVVDVAIVDDQRNEPDETMGLTLSAPGNARLQDSSATGTIIDDDPPPVVTPPTETTPTTTTPPPTETTPTTTTPPPTETTQTTTPAPAPPPADNTPTDPPADSGVTAPPKQVQRAPASTCTVPVLTRHSLRYAIKRLHRWHCALADVVQRFGRGPVGLVVAQRPRSGTTVNRRHGVVLVVSAGRRGTRQARRYAL